MQKKKRKLKVRDPERTVRAKVTFELEIATTPEDCLEVLADALAGDLVQAAREIHKVEAECLSVKVDGKEVSV
jgi:hypothetical protein